MNNSNFNTIYSRYSRIIHKMCNEYVKQFDDLEIEDLKQSVWENIIIEFHGKEFSELNNTTIKETTLSTITKLLSSKHGVELISLDEMSDKNNHL